MVEKHLDLTRIGEKCNKETITDVCMSKYHKNICLFSLFHSVPQVENLPFPQSRFLCVCFLKDKNEIMKTRSAETFEIFWFCFHCFSLLLFLKFSSFLPSVRSSCSLLDCQSITTASTQRMTLPSCLCRMVLNTKMTTSMLFRRRAW